MKRYKIISLIVLAALAGCAKMETVSAPEQEVAFVVANYANRTTAVSVTDEFTTFSSKAFLHAEGVDGTQMFFGESGETITWHPSDHEWTPSHPYYWPKSENSYINFVSWHASAGIVPTTVTETSFVVTRTVEANDELLIADEAWRYVENTTTYNFNDAAPGVPTLFHHLLSRVRVNMTATPLTDNGMTYEVTLQNAHFEGIYQTGSLSLTNSDPNASGPSTKAWTPANINNSTYLWTAVSGSNTGNIAFPDTDITIGTTPTAIQPVRSFLPQALGDGIKMVLTYTVTTKSNGTVTSEESDVTATLVLNTFKNSSNQAITQWVPNKIYTYNIVIDPRGNEILLNPTLVDSEWGNIDISATVE